MTRLLDRIGQKSHRWVFVLIISGVLGFRIGYVNFPTWQVAVETGQVVAGLVKYPSGNPFYVYHTKLWTGLHQICAVLLRAGVSEIALSKLLSGVLGMASFQALAMFVWALSADAVLAIGAPFLIFFTRAAEHGADYPIALLGTDHTYGAIGLSLFALVLALLGAGCVRLGGFLLGIAPAVHASVGAWLWVVVALAFVWDFRKNVAFRPAWKYVLAGCAVAAASLIVQLTLTYDVPKVDAAVSSRYLAAFVSIWDVHRRPVRLWTVGMILNCLAFTISFLWVKAFASDLAWHAVFLVRAVAASAALSLSLMFISWLPPNLVPAPLLVLMPSRLLNFDTMLYVALLLGLLGVYRGASWSGLLTAALAVGLLLSYRSMLWDGVQVQNGVIRRAQFNPLHVLELVSAGLVAAGGFYAWKTRTIHPTRTPPARVARAIAVGAIAVTAVLTWRLAHAIDFRDRTNDAFFAAVAAEPNGLVATGGSFHLVQLYTRRPVLLDGGALDGLPYAAEAGPAMERILGEVYGIDFFNPPVEAKRAGAIPPRVNKPVWEGYSREKWLAIGRGFNVTQVLTRSDWRLDLPVAAENQWLRLYRIPN